MFNQPVPAATPDAEGHQSLTEAVDHCVVKVYEICAGSAQGCPSNRRVLQLGYNLGRLAELTGLGRSVWDDTKQLVEEGRWADIYTKVRAAHFLWLAEEIHQKTAPIGQWQVDHFQTEYGACGVTVTLAPFTEDSPSVDIFIDEAPPQVTYPEPDPLWRPLNVAVV
jgi:hypothetical protein